MKVLLTSDPEIPVPPKGYGGIQRIIDQLALYLKEEGVDIGLVAHKESSLKVDYFMPWRLERSQGLSPLWFHSQQLNNADKQFKPDIIHSFSRLAYLVPLLLKKRSVLMSYQRHPGFRQTKLTDLLSGSSIQFSACSQYISSLRCSNTKNWHVVPNFLPKDLYSPSMLVSEDAPLIFLGRLDQIKGAHTAIKLAKSTGSSLIIAGNVPKTEEATRYFHTAIEPFLSDQIKYLGEVNDSQKQKLLASAKALIAPIEWDEPFGIVYLEALACGTPVITAPRGAAPEIIADNVTGFLCNNYNEYVLGINNIVSIDRKLCRKHFEVNFTRDVVCKKYLALYTNLINS